MDNRLDPDRLATSDECTFLHLLREDWIQHDRDATLPGLRALAVHRFGNWRLGVKPRVLRAPLTLIYRFCFRWVRNHYGIELPYSTVVGRRVRIEHQGAIVVHGGSVIGDDVIVRQGVTIGNRRLSAPHEAPCIGRRVNIGAGAAILGGVRIGDDVSVGALAVVLDDVPAGSIVTGPKATVLPQNGGRP